MKQIPIAIALTIFSLLSCQSNSSNASKEVIAEVKGKYLYLADLQDAIPKGLNGKDSTLFAKEFIQSWISDELMFDVARRNIPDEEKIDQLVEDYRRQLVTNEYKRYLIEEKLSKEISDDEVESYIATHKAVMAMKTSQIRGLYLKIPAKSPNINQLRNWMSLKREDDEDKINRYSIQYAADYENFTERWVDFDEVMSNIPYTVSNPVQFLKQNKQLQVRDSAYFYLLAIQDAAIAGSPFPDDLAKSEARAQLVLQRKVNYLANFRNEIVSKALKNGDAVVTPK
ncbi:MAG: peptidyl-prolyl cis-trans isomerase [Bacteroidales bacterium]